MLNIEKDFKDSILMEGLLAFINCWDGCDYYDYDYDYYNNYYEDDDEDEWEEFL